MDNRIAEISKVLGRYCGFPSAAALKLVELGYTRQSEYEPVELEALGETEINNAIFEQRRVLELNGHKPTTMDSKKAVMYATIQKNQKGQLYKVKE